MDNSKRSGQVLTVLALGLALASCATPQAPTAAAPPAATPPTAAQTAALASAAASARPEFPGFTLTVRQGNELYCQKRSPTGSRARVVETCYTRDQMQKMAENNADFFRQAEANGSHDTLRTDSPR